MISKVVPSCGVFYQSGTIVLDIKMKHHLTYWQKLAFRAHGHVDPMHLRIA